MLLLLLFRKFIIVSPSFFFAVVVVVVVVVDDNGNGISGPSDTTFLKYDGDCDARRLGLRPDKCPDECPDKEISSIATSCN